ncbi:hypothetical protein CU098_008801, partial [Rhizopus stolonifer]
DMAMSEFESVMDKLSTSASASEALSNWCRRVKEYNYEVINTDEALAYWTLRNKMTVAHNTSLRCSEIEYAVSKRALATATSIKKKATRITMMKRQAEIPKHEVDGLKFNDISVGTTIKRHGEFCAKTYHELNKKQQHVAALCLNSIIDLSDQTKDGQRYLFTDEQWEKIKEKYSVKMKHDKQLFKPLFKNIDKALRNLNLDKAYKIARIAEVNALNSDQEHQYNIYSHIINIYRRKRRALNNDNKTNTELDGLVKFWSEVFESLFADNKHNITCKWGESQAYHNEYKIDVRIVVVKGSFEIDLIDVEAARCLYNQKTNDDHLKLAIESKGILDHIVKQSSSFNPRKTVVFMIQICQNQCQVKTLRLCDRGLYCIQHQADLSLPSTPIEFSKNSCSWFAILESIKNTAIKLVEHLNKDEPKSYDAHFGRPNDDNADHYEDWIRGSFFPPAETTDPLILPDPLYGSVDDENVAKKQKIIL